MTSRVLHVIDTTGPGGAETVFVELAARSVAGGYNAVAIVRGKGWVHSALQDRGIKTYVLDSGGSFNAAYLRSLIGLIKAEEIDLVQSHLLGSNLYCCMAALATRRPSVATFHGSVDFSTEERLRRLKVALMNVGVSRYIAVSNSLKRELCAHGIRGAHVIHNGIDLAAYGRERSNDLRQELGLDGDTLLVGALGNVRPAKAYDLLVKAVQRVVRTFPRVHFTIAGDDKNAEADDLKRLAEALQVDKNLHFVGFQKDPQRYLSELDAFVLSSRTEGFSIATIEAQATGVPVVVTRSGGPEEIVRDNINGILVDRGSSEQLAEGICALIRDESLRRRLGAAGKSIVAKEFSVQTMVQRYLNVYGNLLG